MYIYTGEISQRDAQEMNDDSYQLLKKGEKKNTINTLCALPWEEENTPYTQSQPKDKHAFTIHIKIILKLSQNKYTKKYKNTDLKYKSKCDRKVK